MNYPLNSSFPNYINTNGTVIGAPTTGQYVYTAPNTASLDYSNYTYNNDWFKFYDAKSSFFTLSYIKEVLKKQDLEKISNIAETALKNDRFIFLKLEKLIAKSNKFELIFNYIRSVDSISTSHLTDVYFKSYFENKSLYSNSTYCEYSHTLASKLNLRKLFSYAKKHNKHNIISFLFINTKIRKQDILKEDGLTMKNIDWIVNSIDADCSNRLLNLSSIINDYPKEKIYKRLLNIKDSAAADSFLMSIDEPWSQRLRNLK